MRFLKITCEIKDAKPVKTNCNTVWLDIPKEVKAIENDELQCNKAFSVVFASIPEGVTSIGESAFSDCLQSEKIKPPKSLKSIGKRAFFIKSIRSIGACTFKVIWQLLLVKA